MTDPSTPPERLVPKDKLLLTPREAGALLGISRTRVYGLILRDQIEAVQVGKSRRIPRDAVKEYVNTVRRGSAA